MATLCCLTKHARCHLILYRLDGDYWHLFFFLLLLLSPVLLFLFLIDGSIREIMEAVASNQQGMGVLIRRRRRRGRRKCQRAKSAAAFERKKIYFWKKREGKRKRKKKGWASFDVLQPAAADLQMKWIDNSIGRRRRRRRRSHFFFFLFKLFFSVGAFNSFSILFFSDELKWTLEDPPLLNQFQTALCVELSNYYFALGSVLADAILHLATIGQSSISLWWRSVLLRRKHNDFIRWKWWIGRFHTHFLIVTSISMAINSFKVFNHQRDLNSFHLIGWLFVEFKVDGWLTAQVNVGFCSTDCI